MRIILPLLLAASLGVAQDSEKKDTSPTGLSREVAARDGETIRIDVPVSEAARNLLTSVTFPDSLEHVVSGWDEKDLSIERAGQRIFLKLLSKVDGDLAVVTSRGEQFRLHLVATAATAPHDGSVVLKRAETPERAAGSKSAQEKDPGTASGALELVKAMRLGEIPPDATVARGNAARCFESDDVGATLLWVYETVRYRGYVIALANRSAGAYHVDVSRFASERLVLIGARDTVVGPGRSTRLYMVFWK